MNIRDKVLLVEDERTIRSFMQAILTANGYDVLMAGTGAMANTMIASHCPDIIILDLGLPDMDGMTILRNVRKWSKVPILVVSARSHERDKVEALDAGADDYLTKPFGTEELLARIRAAVRHTRTPEGAAAVANSGVFTGKKLGFAPCTPQACMEILDYYGIDCKGKNAVVIGRSLVVGKPAAMMLMAKNATVTVCHTKTVDVAGIARKADILVSAAGVLNSLTKDYVAPGQIVIDVSINWDPEKINSKGGKGAIAGDAVFSEVEPIVEAITPVPGGVGSVTTSVLIGHVVEAAERTL